MTAGEIFLYKSFIKGLKKVKDRFRVSSGIYCYFSSFIFHLRLHPRKIKEYNTLDHAKAEKISYNVIRNNSPKNAKRI